MITLPGLAAMSDTDTASVAELHRGGDFAWRHMFAWLIASVLLGALTAWLAVEVQRLFAPWLLFPLLVGVGLGAMLVGVMRAAHIAHRPTLVTGALLAAAVAVVGQHYAYYRAAQRVEAERQRSLGLAATAFPEVQARVAPPRNVLDFLRREAIRGRPLPLGYVARGDWAWLTWSLEGLLVLAATLAMVIPAMRMPYCRRCGTWYRTIRGGRLRPAAIEPLAALTGTTIAAGTARARYRAAHCQGGCGPTRFLLSWEEPDGRTYMAVAWLDAVACRDALEAAGG
jgi:hypothetical protein